MLLCFKLLVPRVSYLWPYRLCGFTFHTDINTLLLLCIIPLSYQYITCFVEQKVILLVHLTGSLGKTGENSLAWPRERRRGL